MNIPEEAIEKAAMASVNYQARNGDSLPWDALAKFWRDYYREQARAALSAAAPLIAAMAWEEGLDAGADRWMDAREFGEPPANPYEQAG